jgi:hypothetical protein
MKVYVVTIRSRQDENFVPEDLIWPKEKWAKNAAEAINSIFESDGISASMTARDKTEEDRVLNVDVYKFFTEDLEEDDILND